MFDKLHTFEQTAEAPKAETFPRTASQALAADRETEGAPRKPLGLPAYVMHA